MHIRNFSNDYSPRPARLAPQPQGDYASALKVNLDAMKKKAQLVGSYLAGYLAGLQSMSTGYPIEVPSQNVRYSQSRQYQASGFEYNPPAPENFYYSSPTYQEYSQPRYSRYSGFSQNNGAQEDSYSRFDSALFSTMFSEFLTSASALKTQFQITIAPRLAKDFKDFKEIALQKISETAASIKTSIFQAVAQVAPYDPSAAFEIKETVKAVLSQHTDAGQLGFNTTFLNQLDNLFTERSKLFNSSASLLKHATAQVDVYEAHHRALEELARLGNDDVHTTSSLVRAQRDAERLRLTKQAEELSQLRLKDHSQTSN